MCMRYRLGDTCESRVTRLRNGNAECFIRVPRRAGIRVSSRKYGSRSFRQHHKKSSRKGACFTTRGARPRPSPAPCAEAVRWPT